ncbi:MAG: hypothetical protein LBV72_11870 [Tannerella sp.]|jgi:hypothetical protein|nr:hypothetical protein [Tannerella sp.]
MEHPSYPLFRVLKVFTIFNALIVLLALAPLTPCSATIRYLKPSGTGIGTSWSNASGNLQNLINASAPGDSIWVAAGTYKPMYNPANSSDPRDNAFLLTPEVRIFGGFPASGNPGWSDRNPATHPTILSGNTSSGNVYHVVICVGAGNTLLDGFTITGGIANGSGSIQVNNYPIERNSGGGIAVCNASPGFHNLVITGNEAVNGGGIFNSEASPTLTNIALTGNTANAGGGICNHHSNPILTNVTIAGNKTVSATGTAIFVAPNGNDQNTGAKESPLATLAGARNKIRNLKSTSGLPAGGITVYFREGTYQTTTVTELSKEDSGTENSPIVYKAYPGEKPVFNGGSYIKGSDFKNITDASVLSRLSGNAKSKVLCYNLFENGFTSNDLDYSKDFWAKGNLQEFEDPGTHEIQYLTKRMQVYIDDDAMHLARYPNKKAGQFADNPYDVYLSIPEVLSGRGENNNDAMIFRTDETRIKNWKSYDDIVIFGMLGYQFLHNKVIAEKIDPQDMIITLKYPLHHGIDENMRYAFENVLEELDAPGEYYIDKHTGILYLYPAKSLDQSTVKVSKSEANYMIKSIDASYVTFSGLTFELTKGSCLWIKGGSNCKVENCTFKNFGVCGIRLGETAVATRDIASEYQIAGRFNTYLNDFPASDNGFNHQVTGSDFLNTGFAACIIFSGNAANRERGNMLFENNTIRHSGLLGSTYNSGLVLNGVGITIKNNDFFYCRGQAINGNMIDTEIIYNEFCDSPSDMAEDTGTIYLNYICNNDGMKIRYNWFHDVSTEDDRYTQWGFPVRAAVAYDNTLPFQDFSYNVVSNVPMGVYMPRVISPASCINNVFIDCHTPTHYDGWWFRECYENKTPTDMLSGTADGQPSWWFYSRGIYKDEVWKVKYPDLYQYFNYMANEKEDLFQPMDQFYNNLVVSMKVPALPDEYRFHVPDKTDPKYGRLENSQWIESDPGFANYQGKSFQLSQASCNQFGIERIDMSLIGAKASAGNNGNSENTDGEGGGMYNVASSPRFCNSIIWNNENRNIYNNESTPAYSFSLIQGINPPGEGNLNGTSIASNLLFTDASNGDFSLQQGSPTIDAGNNRTYLDTRGIDSFDGEKDPAGNPRLSEKNIDLGAYEYLQSASATGSITGKTAVWSYRDNVYFRSEHTGTAAIYTISGQLLKQIVLQEGITSITLEHGIYPIVISDGTVTRIAVQ